MKADDRRPRASDMVRHVGGSKYDRELNLIDGSAFDRKYPKDEDGLSFTERTILSADSAEDIAQIRHIFASRMKLGKTSCFCEINVGRALDALSEFGDFFEFLSQPLPANGKELANPAHAVLIGLPFEGETVGSLKSELAGDLLRQQIQAIYPAVL